MLTQTAIINGTLKASTNSMKPVVVWGSALKALVFTHPVVFLAGTGAALVTISIYYLSTDKYNKKKAEDSSPVV